MNNIGLPPGTMPRPMNVSPSGKEAEKDPPSTVPPPPPPKPLGAFAEFLKRKGFKPKE